MDEFLNAMEDWLEAAADLKEKEKDCVYDRGYWLHDEQESKKRATKRVKEAFDAMLNERDACPCGSCGPR